jgi:hypothetical protein
MKNAARFINKKLPRVEMNIIYIGGLPFPLGMNKSKFFSSSEK